MKLEQRKWTVSDRWTKPDNIVGEAAQLVFVFGERNLMKDPNLIADLRKMYPKASHFGCSTSGEIFKNSVLDDSLSLVAVQFESTQHRAVSTHLKDANDSFNAGQRLARDLNPENLAHVLVLSVGLNVNGSEIVRGLTSVLPATVSVTGGLAGDKDRFQETIVLTNDGPCNDVVAVVGLYGNSIQVRSASLGGWDPFGPERLVTKSHKNVLYELDGKSALGLYKAYLGKQAEKLPGSALLFPLSIRKSETDIPVVRTILSIDEKEQSLTFAGDVPEGHYGRFMKANFERLIEGAKGAAEKSASVNPELALLISCVGRKIVLKQRVEEEIESVRRIFGEKTILTGFYSYGEISPFSPNAKCELHNQTMTITTLSEVTNGRKAS